VVVVGFTLYSSPVFRKPWPKGCSVEDVDICAHTTDLARLPLLLPPQFVDGIVRQLLELKPQMTTLIDSLEEKVYFTRRRVSEWE
jgi:hypothetical protein